MFVYSLFLLQYHLFVSFYLLFKDFLLLELNLGYLMNYRMTLYHPNRHTWKYSSRWNLFFPASSCSRYCNISSVWEGEFSFSKCVFSISSSPLPFNLARTKSSARLLGLLYARIGISGKTSVELSLSILPS